MPDDVSAERVATIAAAARVPLDVGSAERIAVATAATVKRFAAGAIACPFETEPASYAIVARRDAPR